YSRCERVFLACGRGLEPSAQFESSRLSRTGRLSLAASSGVSVVGRGGWRGTSTVSRGGSTLPWAAGCGRAVLRGGADLGVFGMDMLLLADGRRGACRRRARVAGRTVNALQAPVR